MEKYKSLYNNNEIKISAPTWNDIFELPDGPYSVSDIQNYFQYIIKKHGENIDNPSVRKYVNKTENRFISRIKTSFSFELLIFETMKLLGSAEENKDKMVKKCHTLKYQFVLVYCNIINNDYQQDSRVLYTFVPNKSFGSLLEISPTNFISFKTFNSEFQAIEA